MFEFCRQAGFKIDGEFVETTKRDRGVIPDIEMRMVRVLKAARGSLSRVEFLKRCLNAGINQATVIIYLRSSPLFSLNAKGIVSLRGTAQPGISHRPAQIRRVA